MIFKKMKASAAWLISYLGIEKIETEDGQVKFTEDQRAKIEEKLGAEQAKRLFDNMNAELKALEIDAEAQSQLEAVLKELEIEIPAGTSTPAAATEALRKLKADNDKLSETPEDRTPMKVIKNYSDAFFTDKKALPAHSKTHLFGASEMFAQDYNAFEGRNWNQRAANALSGGAMFSPKATDWNSAESIPKLHEDLGHFIQQNPRVLISGLDIIQYLPSEWGRQSGIVDRIATATFDLGEVTQQGITSWNPKGNWIITVEVGQVYPKKIDLEFTGEKLQSLEYTWLREVSNFSLAGSHPYKMSFIGFILSNAIHNRILEDIEAQINGIYVPGSDLAIHSQHGLKYHYYRLRDLEKKIIPVNAGVPTPQNIDDHVKTIIQSIPEKTRQMQGLEIQMSKEWKDAYLAKTGQGLIRMFNKDDASTLANIDHVVDYPNIKLQAVPNWTGNFMAVTFSKNIEVLEYIPEEANQFTLGNDRRDTWAFADYKLGIRVVRSGIKRAKANVSDFEKQVVWCNNQPIFTDTVSAVAVDTSDTILNINYKNVAVDPKLTTDIEKIEGPAVVAGQVIKITGNTSLVGTPKVKHSSDFIQLAGDADFDLKSGGTLTLLVNADLSLKELTRTSAPPVTNSDINFTESIIDADSGSVFAYQGTTAKDLTDVLNGVEGQQITIKGNSSKITVKTVAGKISVSSNAVLDQDDYIILVKVGSTWYEVNRQISA